MKVRARTAKEDMYWCYSCDIWYSGEPRELEVLEYDYPEYTPRQNLEFIVAKVCHFEPEFNTEAPCRFYDNEQITMIKVGDIYYECGACDEIYIDENEAVRCCNDQKGP